MNGDIFQKRILIYYRQHGRNDLPWRFEKDPYKILVSEVMLQQTQVSRVMIKYPEFLNLFPTFESLATAPLSQVIGAWQGMGYNRRAKFLKTTAEIIVEDDTYVFMRQSRESCRDESGIYMDPRHDLKGPLSNENNRRKRYRVETVQEHYVKPLTSLPGIGHATAAAIVSYAFDLPTVFIETNIRACYLYHFFKDKQEVSDSEIERLVEKTLDYSNPRDWYYALTDYGAMLKRKKKFGNAQSKHYAKQSKFQGSDRQIRGMILSTLLVKNALSLPDLAYEIGKEPERVEQIVSGLLKEELIQKQKNGTISLQN